METKIDQVGSISSTNNRIFHVGQLVEVQARTWPGINRPGGVGRITGIAADRVSVRYVIDGRHEKELECKYVKAHNPKSRLRDRSMLLGRCLNCGSLRTDCGSCDLWAAEEQAQPLPLPEAHDSGNVIQPRSSPLGSEHSDDTTDDDFSEMEHLMSEVGNQVRRYKRMKARMNRHLDLTSSSEEEETATNFGTKTLEALFSELTQSATPGPKRVPQSRARSGINPKHGKTMDQKRRRYVIDDASSSGDSSSSRLPSLHKDSIIYHTLPDVIGDNVSVPGSPNVSDGSNATATRSVGVNVHFRESIGTSSDSDQVVSNDEIIGGALDGFIQPEGRAEALPSDVVDRTKDIPFGQLGTFFDEFANKLETELIPQAGREVVALEKVLKQNVDQRKSDLDACTSLEQRLIKSLIRDGIDQCQTALKKLSDNKRFKRHKRFLPQNLWNRRLDARDFRLDHLRESVEILMRKVRTLKSLCHSAFQDPESDETVRISPSPEVRQAVEFLNDDDTFDSELSEDEVLRTDRHRYASLKHRVSRRKDGVAQRTKKSRKNRTVAVSRMQSNIERSLAGCFATNYQSETETMLSTDDSSHGTNHTKEKLKSSRKLSRSRTWQESLPFSHRALGLNSVAVATSSTVTKKRKYFVDLERITTTKPKGKARDLKKKSAHLSGFDIAMGHTLKKSAARIGKVSRGDLARRLLENHDREHVRNRDAEHECETTRGCAKVQVNANTSVYDKVVTGEVCSAIESRTAPHDLLSIGRLIRSSGFLTLQASLSQGLSHLAQQVGLISSALKLMRTPTNLDVSTIDDGEELKGLIPENFHLFVTYSVAQLIDSLYAIFHPEAWSMFEVDTGCVLQALEPLRDELCKHINLLETVCCLIMNDMPVQCWYQLSQSQKPFVSSFNPQQWQTFLRSGEKMPTTQKRRFDHFRGLVPRVESDAIWSILMFVAMQESLLSSATTSCRWQLINKIIVNQSFSTSNQDTTLPPAAGQLEAVTKDLQCFCAVVLSRGVGDIPRRDKVIMDVVKRSMDLMSDYLGLCELSRRTVYPGIHDTKRARGEVLSFWELIVGWRFKEEPTYISFSPQRVAKSFIDPSVSVQWLGVHVTVPDNCVLMHCLGLVTGWISRAYDLDEKRKNFLNTAMCSLINHLIESSRFNAESTNDSVDRFANAFPADSNGNDSKLDCRAAFYVESASYLEILRYFWLEGLERKESLQHDAMEISQRVWLNLSDEAMRMRKSCGRLEHLQNEKEYKGSQYRLYASSRVLTFLSLMALGISPWQVTLTKGPTEVGHFFTSSQEEGLNYLLTCHASCLDCCRDCRASSEIISAIACSLAVILRCSDLTSSAGYDWFSVIAAPVCRTLCYLLNLSYCGLEEESALTTLLALLRLPLVSTKAKCPIAQPHCTHDDVDCFGDIDDSLLEHLDLGEEAEQTNSFNQSEEAYFQAFGFLRGLLNSARPSCRYNLDSVHGHGNYQPSAHGKVLVGKHAEGVCSCLVSLTIKATGCNDLLFRFLKDCNATVDDRDIMYCQNLSQFISQELGFYYAAYEEVPSHIRNDRMCLFFNLLRGLLDSNTLAQVPSCNLRRIKGFGGASGQKKAVMNLIKFNGKSSPHRMRVQRTTKFAKCFGSILKKCTKPQSGEYRLSSILEAAGDIVPLSDTLDWQYSLEQEILQRLSTLHRIFLEIFATDEFCFQSDTAIGIMLVSSCSHMVRLLKVCRLDMKSNDRHFKVARNFELCTCYIDLFTLILIWIIRSRNCSRSTLLQSTVEVISDKFMLPVLRGDAIRPEQQMESMLRSAQILSGCDVRQSDTSFDEPNETDPFLTLFRDSLVRNSKEIVLAITGSFEANDWAIRLIRALVVAGTGGTEWHAKAISQAFSTQESGGTESTQQCPLQDALSTYFNSFYGTHPPSTDTKATVKRWKRLVMRDILIPTISTDMTNIGSRMSSLRLLRLMLDYEHDEESLSQEFGTIDEINLCAIARGIAGIFKFVLVKAAVDDEHVLSCLQCACAVLSLPASAVCRESVGWIVDWYQDRSAVGSTHAMYLKLVFKWMQSIAAYLVTSDSESEQALHAYRNRCYGEQPSWWISVNEAEVDDLSTISRIESELFCKPKLTFTVTNTYAQRRATGDGEVKLKMWKPSIQVQEAARAFLAKLRQPSVPLRSSNIPNC